MQEAGGREGRRDRDREGGRERGKEGGREREVARQPPVWITCARHVAQPQIVTQERAPGFKLALCQCERALRREIKCEGLRAGTVCTRLRRTGFDFGGWPRHAPGGLAGPERGRKGERERESTR
eukprot:2308488-Rhodomonas_salina.1